MRNDKGFSLIELLVVIAVILIIAAIAIPNFLSSRLRASGQLMYCTDQTSVIHYDPTGSGCTGASQVLQ